MVFQFERMQPESTILWLPKESGSGFNDNSFQGESEMLSDKKEITAVLGASQKLEGVWIGIALW